MTEKDVKMYLGIDPGKAGGYAYISEDGTEAFPFDERELIGFLSVYKDNIRFCVLEKVGAMPGQGVTSMFHFGENFGFIQGVLKSFGIPYELVPPQKWKKEFSITKDKNKSIEVCKRLFPAVNLKRTEGCKKDHDGMAEALLMAEYARRKYGF